MIVTALCAAVGGTWQFVSSARAAKHLESSITGGDSFCYVDPVIVGKSDDLELWPTNSGPYPIYDVAMEIVDGNEFRAFMDEHHLRGENLPLDADELHRRAFRQIIIGNMGGEYGPDGLPRSALANGRHRPRTNIHSHCDRPQRRHKSSRSDQESQRRLGVSMARVSCRRQGPPNDGEGTLYRQLPAGR
jgi:hypothetical protein